jgi:hypothetical protein
MWKLEITGIFFLRWNNIEQSTDLGIGVNTVEVEN